MMDQVFCCIGMEEYLGLLEGELNDLYKPKTRNFSIRLSESDTYGTHGSMLYCPWCGTKLPKNLNHEWSKILREEYEIVDPIFDDADKIPEEFKTDEWWKKRGL